ncbi:hypothetical protein D0Z07_0142 [Hyphodiscus hymeniophilus]|uniref:Uncharacterized protein n=1 Tax=Hyphodiscus hymeniophilus TaxID=353542 RepID=A0A9P6VQZ7_9HELO|nr:hypothetical protein D0Z07_0142 [Hyphodiscus hymeniophilus]
MQLFSAFLTSLLLLPSLANAAPEPQIAQGGGAAATTLAATQQAVTTSVNSLYTLNGVTTASYYLYTQTFASTALGTWDIGATPLSGSIGLGTIQGTIGVVPTNKKRGLDAVETPGPMI